MVPHESVVIISTQKTWLREGRCPMAMDVVAWHDRTAADQMTQYSNARSAGYNALSVCVYGGPFFLPLYAAAMVKRPDEVSEQHAIGMNAASLQSMFDSMAAQGWGPQIITGTGPAANPLFAAVFVPVGAIPFTRFGLTQAEFTSLG